MDRTEKLELIRRCLGLKHKIKVHDAMKAPEAHEELAVMMLAKWDLEDELHAIEAILGRGRAETVAERVGKFKPGGAKKPRK